MTVRVLFAEAGDSEEWDSYIEAHPAGCVYQTSAWRRVVEATYAHQAFYLMARRGDQLCGVLPLFLIQSRLFGRALVSCPFASAGAICADGADDAHILVEHAIGLAQEHRVDYLELKSLEPTGSTRLQHHTDFVNYRLPLDELDNVWRSRLSKSTRRAVRNAEKAGLTVERGPQLLDSLYHIVAVNMRRMGTPVHSRSFYGNILEFFGSQAKLLAVKNEDVAIAAGLLLSFRDEVVAMAGGALPEHLSLGPMRLLDWESIKDAHEAGATSFDFGRSPAGSPPTKYKESWGAEAEPLYYEYYLNRQDSIPRVHELKPSYQLAQRIWKRMPLGFTQLLGPHLMKSVP